MNKIRLTREVRVGIMAIVSIFVLYFGLNFLKGVNIFSPINYYFAEYEHIDGLVKSSPVLIKGYKVGQVEDIKYDFSKAGSFLVKISVSRDVTLPQGVVAELFDDGLMGGKAIQLIHEPYGADVNKHRSGDMLVSAVGVGMIDKLTANLLPQIESVASQTDSLIRTVRYLLDGEAVQGSLMSIAKTTDELALTSASLRRMVQRDIPVLLGDINAVTGNIKKISDNLSDVDFAATFNSLDLTITDLRSVTGKINNGEGSLGLLLNDKELYFSLSETAGSADKLLIDLKQHPKRYVHFSLFGPRKSRQ